MDDGQADCVAGSEAAGGGAAHALLGRRQGGKNLTDRGGTLHRRDQAQAAAAARAREHIDIEGTSHEIGPRPMPGLLR